MNKNKQKNYSYFTNTQQRINRSALNSSLAKRLNTFSKAERFSEPTVPQHHLIKYETEPSELLTKQAIFPTIPKAQRVSFFSKEKEASPSPDKYHVKHEDQLWKVKHKGGTIGKHNYRSLSRNVEPGPTDYAKQEQVSQQNFHKSFTFYRSSRDLGAYFNKGRDSPGPKYGFEVGVLSNKITRGTAVIKEDHKKMGDIKNKKLMAKTNRFNTQKLEQELVTTKETFKNNTKKTFSSVAKQTTRCTFAHKSKEKARNISPGPANYVNFSQFSGWK